MNESRALSTASAAIVIIIVLAAGAGVYLYASQSQPGQSQTSSTSNSTGTAASVKAGAYDLLVVTQKGMFLLYGNPTSSNTLLGYGRVFNIPSNSSVRTYSWYWGNVPTGYTANSSYYLVPISNNTLFAINATTLKLVENIKVGLGNLPWNCLEISPDQKYAAVVESSGFVEVIRTNDLKVVWSHDFSAEKPCHPFWSPDGKYLTLTMRNNNTIDILDASTGVVLKTASVVPYGGKVPYMQTINAQGTLIVVENMASKNDIFYSFPSLQYLGSLNFSSVSPKFAPVRATFTPNGQYVLEESAASDQVAVVSTSDFKIVKVINLPAPVNVPAGLADGELTPDGQFFYVVQPGNVASGGVIYVISVSTFEVVNTIPMTTAPAFAFPVSVSTGTYLAENVLSPPVAGLHC